MTEFCRTCNYSCEDFTMLAKHIIQNKRTHKKGLKWASSFLTKAKILNRKPDLSSGRTPLTEEQKQAKQDSHRILSGIEKTVMTYCPGCNHKVPQRLPVEFIQSNFAWKNNNLLMINCVNCRH